VEKIVERAHDLEYPVLGLTDHGKIDGAIALYTACRKFGIEPAPGMELYVVPDAEYAARKDSMHMTMVAYSEQGYRNLVRIASLSNKNFYYKPVIDFADFAQLASDGYTKGLAVATGCYFGVIPQTLMRRGHSEAVKVAKTLAGWFPQVYVELQNHGIGDEHHSDFDVTDDELISAVYDVSQSAGLPCVITRDSHFVDEKDKPLHDGLKRLLTWSDDVDDAPFPGGGYHMTDLDGMKRYMEPKYIAAGMEGLAIIANKAYLRLPELENFKLRIPDVTFGQDPQKILEEKVMAVLVERGLDKDPVILAQVHREFDTFRFQAMAPYILLVLMVCQFMRKNGISFHTRGSATGSMVNYLLGITQLDPIKFGLRFDRFMSTTRLKPPDVDLDIEHDRVDEVVVFLHSLWNVCRIGSHMSLKLDEDSEEESGSGSLKVKYYTAMSKKGTPVNNWRDIPRDDKDLLKALSSLKLYSGYGTHAAGYIIAPDQASIAQLPMAFMPKQKKFITAYGKKDVERLGFLKLDLLGLRTRTAIRVTEELTGIPFDSIPLNDKATFAAISRGDNMGVFQLEGYTMNFGCKQIRPTKIDDVIAAQALFRPATMHSDATQNYRDRRTGREAIPVRHPDIMESTAATFGVMLYQEDVMEVCDRLGMNAAELEEMLGAVKASNEYSIGAAEVISGFLPRIKELAGIRGWSSQDVAWFVESLDSYADYSFPKAHAASYGVVSYGTAYMKCHYATEFWTGILTAYGNHKKEKMYVPWARRTGIKILPPLVNHSGMTYVMDRSVYGIRKGFLSVAGVGPVAAAELAEKAPYKSLRDLGERVLPRKVSGAKKLALGTEPVDCGGIIKALSDARVLDGLEKGI
jgi:DNA polymerase-3 subunit alpha